MNLRWARFLLLVLLVVVAFPATADPIILQHPEPSENDRFGAACAANGRAILVGAPLRNIGEAKAAGSAYIFDARPGAARGKFITRLENTSAGTWQYFGGSVAFAGNLAVVAAYHDNTAIGFAGAIHIYDGDPESVDCGKLLKIITDPARSRDDQFGAGLATTANKILVGAPNDNNGALHAGSAYLIEGDATGGALGVILLQIHNPAPAPVDDLGAAVALSDDYILVGAPGDDAAGTDSGSAYLFDAEARGATRAPLLALENPAREASTAFGAAVAIAGDWLAVGAPKAGGGVGAVYVGSIAALRAGGKLVRLKHPIEAATPIAFGRAVVAGEKGVWVAGACHDAAATNAAALYGYGWSGDPVAVRRIISPQPTADKVAGYSSAEAGENLVLGSPLAVQGGKRCGAAYLFDLPTVDGSGGK